jgi:hypothetical protein
MRNENNNNNRVLKDLLAWSSKHAERKQAYPNYTGQEKYVLKDRLKHMIAVRDKYKSQPLTKDERKELNTLKKKINELNDQLYPTLIEKLFARIGRFIDKVRDNMRYRQSNTTTADPNQEVRSLTNRQKLKNAVKEKLVSVKEKLLPNTQKQQKNEQVLSNHVTVTKDTFKQKNDMLSIGGEEKKKHRLRL